MPSLKNPDWRRAIPEVVLDIIARDGLEATSVRRIAKELGFSTAVVTHTFPEKNDLLMSSYRRFVASADRRYREIIAEDPTDIVGYLMTMVIRDANDLKYWRAYVAIWDKVLSDDLFKVELQAWIERGIERIEQFINAYRPGYAHSGRLARQLLALVRGISEQQILDPTSWPTEAMREVFKRTVECELGVQGEAGARAS